MSMTNTVRMLGDGRYCERSVFTTGAVVDTGFSITGAEMLINSRNQEERCGIECTR